MKIIIITGMSGAGRSRAANWFEDQGYYCVDNMPPELIYPFLDIASADTGRVENVAFVADLRSGSFFDKLSRVIDDLRKMQDLRIKVDKRLADISEEVKEKFIYSAYPSEQKMMDNLYDSPSN
jgi:UPF0042 nucleotide-binding protein